MQRRRVQRGNNGHVQDDGTSRKLSKKPSEEKCDDKDKTKKGTNIFRKLGFVLHADKDKSQDNGSTLKRRKQKKGTERKRKSAPVWNPDKKVHFNIEKTHASIPLKGEPISDIQKKVFLKFATEAVKKSPPEYSMEFLTKIKPYPGQPLERKIFDANPTKNRYKDVVCNDVTRVILNDGSDNDYIHANYVNGLNTPFILSQGPTAATIIDFWRMIVHTKSAYIVMLCETVEDGKPKCAQYYPDKVGDSVTYGAWTISCTLEDSQDANIIKRSLTVKNGENGKEHSLRHLHTKSWPDRSVPKSTMCLLRILYSIRTAQGPVTVHCSAGIGRTGTFVAIEACLQILTDGKELDLLATCKALRNSRAGSVQVDIQYMTLIQMLLNYGKDNGYWDDADLDDRVELLTWNIEQFIQTRGRVDHILATPSTPALSLPQGNNQAVTTTTITTTTAPPPPPPPKEPTILHSPAQKAQECMEKICEKILKPLKKDKDHQKIIDHHKEHKSPKEEPKEHPLPMIVTKSSTEDGDDTDEQKHGKHQKQETKEIKEMIQPTQPVHNHKEEDSVLTGTPGPPPLPSPVLNPSPNGRKEMKISTDSRESLDKTVVSREFLTDNRSNEKEKMESKEANNKLMKKLSANCSQYL